MSDPADPVPAEPPDRILTLDEVAERVQLSTRTVRRAILAGDLEASQLTPRRGGWRVYETALADWMTRRSNRIRAPRDPAALPAPIDSRPAARPPRHRRRPPHRRPRHGARGMSDDSPPRPDTPRGIEPRLRQGPDGPVWRFRVRWRDPRSGRRLVEELDTVADALDFRAHLRLARRRGVLSELDRGSGRLDAFVERWWTSWAAHNLTRPTLRVYANVWNLHACRASGRCRCARSPRPQSTSCAPRSSATASGLPPSAS
jgi:excisionase family DNA binding protein